ncbi:N-acetylmuramoyl-L-alanine amidase [Amycolatopsis acididurans]|uniref:N-acetylmuramoyl-L-alanine amidase n=1 Tax=Amycolatopsis acididurans TaxID=2724524 RepID=UPI0028AD9E1F|nr:N-acetylmuramoyl-L-alanine amidase [Amycolatopsis acididurans]
MFAVRWHLFVVLLGTALLGGCSGGGGAAAPAPSSVAATSAAAPPSSSAPAPAPSSSSPAPSPVAHNLVVVIDPGHNGGNASNPGIINKQVPAGRGRTKPCNTTGTATNGGYTEHAFTWDVARRVGAKLTERGIRVVYTRADDNGVGPCVDKRAEIGNEANAAAVVSIHADGSTSAGAHGFHVAYSSPALNAAQGEPSMSLARTLRDALRETFPVSNYLGNDGLAPRDDLAGLNLSTRPAALIECGNMRNSAEAAEMSTSDGRQRYADSIAAGILSYLG